MELNVDKMKQAFFPHNAENERLPVEIKRSSAVFYFICDKKVNTEINYLNYWVVKRGVSGIKRRVTLREMNGDIALQFSDIVKQQGSHTLDVGKLLLENKLLLTEGSIEFEFLSTNNLYVAYPALVVRYIGANWHSSAHSTQRYYSQDSGDNDCESLSVSEEGNITIQAGSDIRAFVIVHNGHRKLEDHNIRVKITSSDGRVLRASSKTIGWDPYQTRLIYLDEIVDYKSFLRGGFGTFSINMLSSGVFPRLIGGCERNGVWSIDHTNFSAIDGAAAKDVIRVNEEEPHRSLVFNLPNNVSDNWNCFADIYPTFPEDKEYEIFVREVDNNGNTTVVEQLNLSHNNNKFRRIIVDNNLINKGSNIELSFENYSEVPRRFHLGIHYQSGDGLPGFLTDGPVPYTTPGISTRWYPVYDVTSCKNILMLAHRMLAGETANNVEFNLRLYNSFGDDPQTNNLVLKPYEQICLELEDMFPNASQFLKDKSGWVYMTSPEKHRSVIHYASSFGENSISVCHAF